MLGAFALTPEEPQLVHALALLYKEQGDNDAGGRFASELVRLRPKEPSFREFLKEVSGN